MPPRLPILCLLLVALSLFGPAAAAPTPPAPDADTQVIPRSHRQFERLTLAPIPVYQPARGTDGQLVVLTRQQILDELRSIGQVMFKERGHDPLPPPTPRISCRFDSYAAIDDAWFASYLRWFRKELSHLHLSYRPENWDCDDFSLALNAFADLAQLGEKQRTPPHLIGRIAVQQLYPWGGVAGGQEWHEIVIYRSATGWWVVDPRSGITGPLSDYPNRFLIREVLFN